MQVPSSRRKPRPADGSKPSSPSASQPKLASSQSLTLPGGPAGRVAAIGGVVVVMLLAAIGGSGSAVFTQTVAFLDFGAGVLALVSLSVTVMWGLSATDRLFLQPSYRLLAQGVHRATAVSGITFLGLHIWVKVAQNRTSGASVILPFADVNQPFLIGLGTIAGYLFVAVTITGAMRSVFTTNPKRARRWRILHMSAYPAWGAALLHGLQAGRPAAGYITAMYAMCVSAVAIALVLRMNAKSGTVKGPRAPLGELPKPERRSAPAIPGKPSQDPVGLLDPAGTGAGRRQRADAELPWPARASSAQSRPQDQTQVQPQVQPQPDPELPWSAGPRSEPSPVPRPEPRMEPARPAYADSRQESWASDPLTGELPVMSGMDPSALTAAGMTGVQGVPGATGAQWPVPPEPAAPEPVGAPWPRSAPEPAPGPVGMPWPRGPEPQPGPAPGSAPDGSPWSSTMRPQGGEPWAPTPDASQTGRRVNGRAQ